MRYWCVIVGKSSGINITDDDDEDDVFSYTKLACGLLHFGGWTHPVLYKGRNALYFWQVIEHIVLQLSTLDNVTWYIMCL